MNKLEIETTIETNNRLFLSEEDVEKIISEYLIREGFAKGLSHTQLTYDWSYHDVEISWRTINP